VDSLLPYLPFVLGGIAVVIAIGLIAVSISNANQSDPLAERLADYADRQTRLPISKTRDVGTFHAARHIGLSCRQSPSLHSVHTATDTGEDAAAG